MGTASVLGDPVQIIDVILIRLNGDVADRDY